MSDAIKPMTSIEESMLLQVIQRETEKRRKDKYRDPDRYPRAELLRSIQETTAMHLQAYLELEAQRGDPIATEGLMRDLTQSWPWAWPHPQPPPQGIDKLRDRAFYSMHTNAVFCRAVDAITHHIAQEVEDYIEVWKESNG